MQASHPHAIDLGFITTDAASSPSLFHLTPHTPLCVFFSLMHTMHSPSRPYPRPSSSSSSSSSFQEEANNQRAGQKTHHYHIAPLFRSLAYSEIIIANSRVY